MPIVTRVTPGTNDVRINDATERQCKHVEDKWLLNFADIDLINATNDQ